MLNHFYQNELQKLINSYRFIKEMHNYLLELLILLLLLHHKVLYQLLLKKMKD